MTSIRYIGVYNKFFNEYIVIVICVPRTPLSVDMFFSSNSTYHLQIIIRNDIIQLPKPCCLHIYVTFKLIYEYNKYLPISIYTLYIIYFSRTHISHCIL